MLSLPRKTKKLSYKDQRELESLPKNTTLEEELEAMQEKVNDPDTEQDSDITAKALAELADKEELLRNMRAGMN